MPSIGSGSGEFISETLTNNTENPIDVTYVISMTTNGCTNTQNVTITVDPVSVLSMPKSNISVNETILLSPQSDGIWTSSNDAVATVTNDGVVTGIAAGIVTFTYINTTTGCSAITKMLTVHALPTYLDICDGNSVTFDVGINNGGTLPLYQWQKNGVDLNGAIDTTYTCTPQDGDTIRCLLISNADCANPITVISNIVIITVNPNADASTINSITGDNIICAGTTTTFTVNADNVNNPVYRWYESETATSPFFEGSYYITPSLTADTTFYVSVEGSNYCKNLPSERTVITVTVNNNPTISAITSPDMHCAGESLVFPTLTVTANGSPIISQGWQIEGAVDAGTFNNITLPFTVNRLRDNGKKIRYFATNDCGTTYSNEVVLTIHAKPVMQTAATAPAATCEGKIVFIPPVLVSGEGEAFTQVWQMETAAGSGVFVDFATPYTASYRDNNKKIRHKAVNTCGTSYSNEVTLTINPLPVASIAGSNAICVGTTTQLLPKTGGTWTSTNSSVATVDNNGFVTGKSAGTAKFIFTSFAGCVDTTQEVTVGTFPAMPVITAAKNAVCISAEVKLSGAPAGGVWKLSNDNVQINGSSTSNPVVIQGNKEGKTYISYTVGTGACQSTATFLVKIVPTTQPKMMIGFER
jgi:uncharacterized protein YjdB